MYWGLSHRFQKEEAILELSSHAHPLPSPTMGSCPTSWGSVGLQDGFKVVSGWRGNVLYPSTAYIPPLWAELGSILTWGSGREAWGGRGRGGACWKERS